MANLLALGMQSLQEHVDPENGSSQRLYDAYPMAVASSCYKAMSKPTLYINDPPKVFEIRDLNLQSVDGLVHLKYLVDLLRCYSGEINIDNLSEIMSRNAYKELPVGLRPKTDLDIPYTMQLLLTPTNKPTPKADAPAVTSTDVVGVGAATGSASSGGPSYTVLKLYAFEKQEKLHILKDHIVVGDPLSPHWGRTGDRKTPIKVLLYMLDRLGGFQYRYNLPHADANA
jgi:hypothetical protein